MPSKREQLREDANQLAQRSELFAADEHQFWIWTGYAAKTPLVPALSPTVRKLLSTAKAARCAYVQLDGDGPIYADLPQFDW